MARRCVDEAGSCLPTSIRRPALVPPPGEKVELRTVPGDFRIIREIARGGMGVVFEAEQIFAKPPVTLEILPFAATLDSAHWQAPEKNGNSIWVRSHSSCPMRKSWRSRPLSS
jgi:hypothetical protein